MERGGVRPCDVPIRRAPIDGKASGHLRRRSCFACRKGNLGRSRRMPAGRGGCRASVADRDARRPSTCATRDDSKPVSARGLNRGGLRSLGRSVRLPNSARSFGGRAGSLRHSRRRSQGRDVDRRVVNHQYTDDWGRTLRRDVSRAQPAHNNGPHRDDMISSNTAQVPVLRPSSPSEASHSSSTRDADRLHTQAHRRASAVDRRHRQLAGADGACVTVRRKHRRHAGGLRVHAEAATRPGGAAHEPAFRRRRRSAARRGLNLATLTIRTGEGAHSVSLSESCLTRR